MFYRYFNNPNLANNSHLVSSTVELDNKQNPH